MTPFSLPTHLQIVDPNQAKAILRQQVQSNACVLFLTENEAKRLQLTESIQTWVSEGLFWIPAISDKLTLNSVRETLNVLIGKDIETILAIGDQTTLELAKVIANVWHKDQKELSLSDLSAKLSHVHDDPDHPHLTALAIPTDYSSRSALSFRVEITDELKSEWIVIEDPRLAYDRALIVSEWMSPHQATILKAGYLGLSQASEATWSINSGPFVQSLAIQAIKLIVRSLPVVLQNPHQPQARQALITGCLQAAMAQNNTQVGAAHGLALALTQHSTMSLAVASVLTLPDFLKLNLAHLVHPENLYEAFNINNPQELRAWLEKNAEGLCPMTLSQVGLREKDLESIATQALQLGHPKHNPVPLTRDLFTEFLKLHL